MRTSGNFLKPRLECGDGGSFGDDCGRNRAVDGVQSGPAITPERIEVDGPVCQLHSRTAFASRRTGLKVWTALGLQTQC